MMSTVAIHPYSSDWPLQFTQVQAELFAVFDDPGVRVEHIGSTAVPGLSAKPIIDVLLGADSLAAIESKVASLEGAGYR